MNQIHERKFMKKGSVIMHQGDDGSCAYLIQSGTVKIYAISPTGKMVDLGKLGIGQIFGEMALVADGKRGATVEALEDVMLIQITREMLQEKLQKSDPTVRALMPMLMERLKQSNTARLKTSGTADEMKETVEGVYRNMRADLPPARAKTLDNSVKPALDAFLEALSAFQRNY